MTKTPARTRASHWPRVRGVCAVAAVGVFLTSAALAPFSVNHAHAAEASKGWASRGAAQDLTAAGASEELIDTAITSNTPEDSEKSGEDSEKSGDDAENGKALYTLEEFMFSGVINWGGYKFTFYSEQVLPGPGLAIAGRHVNDGGYVSDGDGYIVLAGDAPKGTVVDTPFGYQGKIYDRGTYGNHLDVYIR